MKKLLSVLTILYCSSTSAGILNYHRNFGLACVNPNYKPAMEVRNNSVALADSIRALTKDMLDLTYNEEHWSLEVLKGNFNTVNSYQKNMLTISDQLLKRIQTTKELLGKVKEAQTVIVNDAKNNKLSKEGMKVYSTMTKTQSIMKNENFESRIDHQFSEYDTMINKLEESLKKTSIIVKSNQSTPNKNSIFSTNHRELSNQIRESTRLNIELINLAEKISYQTVQEVRETSRNLGITSCNGLPKS
ncbi:hypothetical protein ACT41S_11065 [Acinetobacter baumannii]